MKKIISVVLALTMIMMLGVCAFATDVTGPSDSGTGETSNNDVKVRTNLKADTDYGSYTVTIPAEIVIDWEAEAADLTGNATYTVTERQLKTGASLKVSVADKTTGLATGKLTKADVGELDYTLAGGTEATFDEVIDNATNGDAHEATVTVNDWTKAPIDVYEGYLTYKVVYTAPADTTTP